MMQLTKKYLTHLLKIFFLGLFLSFSINDNSFADIAKNGTGTWVTNNNSFIDTSANILVNDAGFYAFDGTSGTWVKTFNTNKLCPTGYSEYIQLSVDKIYPNIENGQYCYTIVVVPPIKKNASNYTVSVWKTNAGNSGGLAFTWVLYCYPPGFNTPGYDSIANGNC